jgi:pimeloyl-ACP methyl ester carboxylesterase
VLGLRGDVRCGGAFGSWRLDVAKQLARVVAALGAAGLAAPRDAIAFGYSQGALLAEGLCARCPAAYSRAVLIGAPRAPSPASFRRARGAVMMAGQFDAKQVMKDGARALAAAGVPSTYIEIAGARHGPMGDGERVMGAAFAWLEANAKPAGP